ncbi:hypothetical protein SAMN05428938_4981 [Streptomyces sp. KS_5]|nr:hypothetical protein SAMN05428938_4981 [Streptomyces sp. KS_5]
MNSGTPEVLVVDPQSDGLQALPGGLPGLLQHAEPVVGRGDGHHPAVGAEQAGLLQHVLAVEAELDVDVEREGVEPAVDDTALPQGGVEVGLPYAVPGEQLDVPGVQEAAGREAGDPAEVHHAEVGCAVAGGGHGELGVEGVAPLEGGVLHVDAGVRRAEGVEHRDHVGAVAAAEQVPVAHPGVRAGGERVGTGAQCREAEAAGHRQSSGGGQKLPAIQVRSSHCLPYCSRYRILHVTSNGTVRWKRFPVNASCTNSDHRRSFSVERRSSDRMTRTLRAA